MDGLARRIRTATLVLLAATCGARAELPVPCSPCVNGSSIIPWTNPAGLSAAQRAPQIVNGGRDMLIRQGRKRQVYAWETFNIGRGRSVEFRQPGSTAVALNRVLDPKQRMSVIEGALRANGQVYLINRNGVLLKRGASVDVNTFLASTLDLNQDIAGLFEEVGIGNVLADRISVEQTAALVDDLAGLPGNVVVEQGAVIEAGRNGRIILVGAEVENRGALRLSGPGGQALLVAGEDRVYFFRDDGVGGLGVELGTGGTVANVGQIIAGNGSVTLAGLTVNQAGVIRASTAVSANGTIRLQARDQAFTTTSPDDLLELENAIELETIAARAGDVSFGAGSVTEVLPDADSPDQVVDEQDFLRSTVEVRGENIVMARNARITAPAGRVEFIAAERPDQGNTQRPGAAAVDAGSIALEAGATIDVGGLEGVDLPASRNVLSLQLRRAELAGSPVNREGPLLGSTISFDLRDPPAFVDVSGAVESLGRGVLERSTIGGTIGLFAADRVTLARGSRLDVSGGSIDFSTARGEISRVIVDNKLLDLNLVGAGTPVEAVVGPGEAVHPRWGYSSVFGAPGTIGTLLPAYTEGKDAGEVEIASINIKRRALNPAPDQLELELELDGEVLAGITRGQFQLERPANEADGFARPFDQVPRGGRLEIAARRGDFSLTAAALEDEDGNALAYDGLSRFDLDVGSFEIPAGASIEPGPGATLEVETHLGGAEVAGSWVSPDGEVELAVGGFEADLVLAAGGTIDVAGTWVNDAVPIAERSPAFIDGGRVTLSGTAGGAVRLAAGSRIVVDGGARLLEGGEFVAGSGGSIAIDDGLSALTQTLDLTLDTDLSGFVFSGAAAGSRLSLDVRQLTLAAGPRFGADADGVTLGPAFFLEDGFTDFALASTLAPLTVRGDFELDLVPDFRVTGGPGNEAAGRLPAQVAAGAPSGTPLDEVGGIAPVADPLLRVPTSIALASTEPEVSITSAAGSPGPVRPSVVVEQGADIAADVRGAIALRATGSVAVAGSLSAPAGSIAVELLNVSPGYVPSRGIWLLDGASLDVAGMVVDGGVNPLTGAVRRRALPAGEVVLRTGITPAGAVASTGGGYIVAYPGARIDISGATGTSEQALDSGGVVPVLTTAPLAGDAGTLTLEASHGVQFFAAVDAAADAALGAAAGTLSLTLDADRIASNDTLDFLQVPFPELSQVSIVLDEAAGFPDLEPLGNVDDALFGTASVDLDGYRDAGFAALELTVLANDAQINADIAAENGLPVAVPTIALVGDLRFDAGERLLLNAPVLASDGGRAVVAADYLALGFVDETATERPADVADGTGYAAAPGVGSAIFEAGFIDLNGLLSLRGFGGSDAPGGASSGLVAFLSDGDLRLNGTLLPRGGVVDLRDPRGRLDAAGDVLLKGARIYASTLTDYVIENARPGAAVSFLDGRAGAPFVDGTLAPLPAGVRSLLVPRLGGATSKVVPQSGGAAVTVGAEVINQFGQVFVPFGGLTLDAETRLTLGQGSLSSVTGGENTTLFGETVLGEWVFPFVDDRYTDFTLVVEPGSDDVFAIDLPRKNIRLVADGVDGGDPVGTIDLRPGAVLDVRGGGSLVASEFVQGPVGKVDLLDAARGGDEFALLPVLGDTVAAVDPVEVREFGLDLTTQIEIVDGGVSGLAAGRYAVLPPRYALLPGAVLLTPAATADTTVLGASAPATTADGLPLVRGVMTRFGRADVNPLAAAQYRVETTADVLNRAEYRVTRATDFFPVQAANLDRTAPLLPLDAGAVQAVVNAGLNLGGSVARGGAAGGLGSRIDIAAERLLVAGATDTANPDDAVLLTTAGLEGLGADSLLLGGTRRVDGNNVRVEEVVAATVTVAGDARLQVPEVTLVATESVRLAAGSALEAAGAAAGAGSGLSVAGDAAVVRASTDPLP
ncbi:MAG: two-partner secretion domain-containing protein, partial [Gammaproteobacteria bacterium]